MSSEVPMGRSIQGKDGPSKICGTQPLTNLKEHIVYHTPSKILKAVFHKFYLVHS